MKRKHFIKALLGTSTVLLTMDGISTLASALSLQKSKELKQVSTEEIASFGAIHLNNTSLEKAITFWTKVIGLKLRSQTDSVAEFGTENKTLVVIHQSAKSAFTEGYSGLYHFAIHLPNKAAFAKAIYRLQQNKHSFSPVDHTMTQSLYLTDYDNVMVELALESPERFKRVITEGRLFMEDTDGTIRGASAPLDTEEILKSLVDKDLSTLIDKDAKIGHIHFYARDVDKSNRFYKKLGFIQSNYFPNYKFADLGAGSSYTHRIAMNAWHGNDRPMAPESNAGLNHYHIIFSSKEQLQQTVKLLDQVEEKDEAYWTKDATGVRIKLTA
ncbi:MAG: hypothetical protein RL660_1152 [Bacteroidota bacterium]|jgi:catechol 2,3-dioxygenase